MADTTTSTTTVPYSPKSIYGNRYVVRDHLGTGRYGQVYLCSDRRKEHKDIVLKVPYQSTPNSLKRHRREAKIMRHLRDLFIDHTASYRDFTEDDALVMDHIEGFSLSSVSADVSKPALSAQEIGKRASYLFGPVACLEAITAHDILHRDIKPENILVEGRRGKLIDWNLAGKIDEDAPPRLIGTPDYMAPEILAQREAASAASEVYALGATLYATLFCKPPRGIIPPDLSKKEVLQKLLTARIPDPSRVYSNFPRNLSTLMMSALDPRRDNRPDLEEFSADLKASVHVISAQSEAKAQRRGL